MSEYNPWATTPERLQAMSDAALGTRVDILARLADLFRERGNRSQLELVQAALRQTSPFIKT